jgi:hypothetical protein
VAAVGEVLFLFFLLVGFGEQGWAWAVSLILTLLMAAFFLSGLSLSRSGRGGVEISEEGLIFFRGKQQQMILWQEINAIDFGGIFQGWIAIKTRNDRGIIYRALPGYPLIWKGLSTSSGINLSSDTVLKIFCRRSQHMITILMAMLLLVAATVFMIFLGLPAGLSPIVVLSVCSLFLLVTLFGLWAIVHNNQVVTMTPEGLIIRSWGKVTKIPTAIIKEVKLVQAPIKELVVGYRYRGELLPAAVSYAPVELGLGVHLILEAGEWGINETMTGYPMELLYEELCWRYQLSGEIIIAEEP